MATATRAGVTGSETRPPGRRGQAFAGNVAKGRQGGVTGRLAYDGWESEFGDLRSKLYVIADTVDFLFPGLT